MKPKLLLSLFLIFAFVFSGIAQEELSFLTKSDSVNKSKLKTVYITETVIASSALIGLNQLWYADYKRSKFHFINDNSNWLQMDKIGHVFSAYQLGRLSMSAMDWAGASKKDQLLYGAPVGFVFLTAVEILDGFSSEWGASTGDLIANAAGTTLLIGQELGWGEQRISLKYSFHQTKYAGLNPNALGENYIQQTLKDYNGQTYWISANIWSFAKESEFPKWLNIAFGYGAEGMLASHPRHELETSTRYRQFYASFDLDLTKIKTKSKFLKTLFTTINFIKIPAPAIEFTSNGKIKGHWIYY
ncbi:DUF2279 domain-containing protein [Flavicella sp.]|uniref:DUF2279 domain-containing protein n=1 Tax=Flavicella sp. TaxID=2957742 RepID=UPI00301780B0